VGTKKRHTNEFKAKVGLAALRGDRAPDERFPGQAPSRGEFFQAGIMSWMCSDGSTDRGAAVVF